MRLLYVANQRLPTEKAYGLQITKMCQAFAGLGAEVELLVPTRRNSIKKDIFDYYSVGRTFKFKKIFAPDFYLPGRFDLIAFWIKNFFSGLVLFVFALGSAADIIFSRDELPIYFLSFFKNNLVFEAHRYSKSKKFFYRRFKNAGVKLVTISQGLTKEFLQEDFERNNILTSPDGVDLEEFALTVDKAEARKRVGLPTNKKIILYSGQLLEWKGADILAEASTHIEDGLFVFVGGVGEDLAKFKKRFAAKTNVLILGQKPHNEIPHFLKAADVLVLPNKRDGQISEFYTSPLKMFEYMAAQRPIVASNLPSLREILDDHNSVLVEPDDVQALANGIKKILGDPATADLMSQAAFQDVKQYTWQKRAEHILDFLT